MKVWAYGHTHKTADQIIFGCRVVSNQLGYVRHHDRAFTPNFVVDVADDDASMVRESEGRFGMQSIMTERDLESAVRESFPPGEDGCYVM